jgi:predicted type IV restriction endonuclease
MDLIDQLMNLSAKISKMKDKINNEESTKNAFVLPFINALGYDVFDPHDVVPEFTSDVGTKKGEKVDYAIFKDSKPIMFFECKKCGCDLEKEQASQLYRYFATTSQIKLAVLTNGILYHFYSDLENSNIMDSTPFFELNMLDIQESSVSELKKLSKNTFNLEQIMSTASELKYLKDIKRLLSAQWESPTEDFVKFFVTNIYSGVKTQKVMQQFTDIVKKALNQFMVEEIGVRLKAVLNKEAEKLHEQEASDATKIDLIEAKNMIETTEEEIESFIIIKTILRDFVDSKRLSYKDSVNYFSISLDNSSRKQICRLYLHSKIKYLGLFDNPDRKEEKLQINSLDDIFNYKEKLIASLNIIFENK